MRTSSKRVSGWHRAGSSGLLSLLVACGSSITAEPSPASSPRPLYCIDWDRTVEAVRGGAEGAESIDGRTAAVVDSSSLGGAKEWADRIRWAEQMIANLPPEWQAAGAGYLDIVTDRAELMEAYGYPEVRDLPADVRGAFVTEHFDAQQSANELIAFLNNEC